MVQRASRRIAVASIAHWLPVIGIIVSVALLFAAVNDEVDVDDAYISYRYAQNFADGKGLVYNPAERTYGITSILWTVLVGVASAVSRAPVDAVANILCFLVLALTMLLAYWYLRRHDVSLGLGLLLSVLGLSSPLYLLFCTTGMETGLYVLFILSAGAAAISERRWLAGFCAGLAFATRPDGFAVLVAVIAVVCFFERTTRWDIRGLLSKTIAVIGGFAIIAIPHLIFCLLYYGRLLPETLAAKRAHQLLAGRWWMPLHFLAGPGLPVLLFALAGLVVAGFVMRQRSEASPFWLRVFAFTAVWLTTYALAWSVVGIDFYGWYVAAMGPASALLVVSVLGLSSQYRLGTTVVRALLVAVIAVAGYWVVFSSHEIRRFHAYVAQLEVPRKHLGETIRDATIAPREIVGLGAIGLIGYYCRACRILDYSGLVTPRPHRSSMPAPTLRVGFLEEVPAHAQLLFMYSGAFPAGPDLLVWTTMSSGTTWNSAQVPAMEAPGTSFGGKVTLAGVTPRTTTVKAGGVVQVETRWQFREPLPPDRVIAYYLGNVARPSLSYVDTRGLYRGRRAYQLVRPGEVVLDFVNIPVPADAPGGEFQVAVMVYPTEGFECPAGEQSAVHPGMRRIMNARVVP